MKMITIYKNTKKFSDIKFSDLKEATKYFIWRLDEFFKSYTQYTEVTKFCGKRTTFYFKDEDGHIVSRTTYKEVENMALIYYHPNKYNNLWERQYLHQ